MNEWYKATLAALRLEVSISRKKAQLSRLQESENTIGSKKLHREIVSDSIQLEKLRAHERQVSRKALIDIVQSTNSK